MAMPTPYTDCLRFCAVTTTSSKVLLFGAREAACSVALLLPGTAAPVAALGCA